jgi:HSP20 family molecular chaperone IbpA
MLDEIDRFLRQISRVQHQLIDLFNQWSPAEDARIQVIPDGNLVKIRVESPGINGQIPHGWAIRAEGKMVYLRGATDASLSVDHRDNQFQYNEHRHERFVKAISLPFPVKPEPLHVRAKQGVVTIILEKLDGATEDDWIPLRRKK